MTDKRTLADDLNRYIGTTRDITTTCEAITRAAKVYDRIQERWCNEEMSDATTARLEATEATLEDRIASLVQDLPHTDDGPFKVQFDGDPRGWTVRLIAPDGHEIGCNR